MKGKTMKVLIDRDKFLELLDKSMKITSKQKETYGVDLIKLGEMIRPALRKSVLKLLDQATIPEEPKEECNHSWGIYPHTYWWTCIHCQEARTTLPDKPTKPMIRAINSLIDYLKEKEELTTHKHTFWGNDVSGYKCGCGRIMSVEDFNKRLK